MAQEPTFPEDASVAGGAADKTPLNETLSHAVTAKQAEERTAEQERSGRSRRLIKGAAIGVGSAALVAALLYARSSWRSDRDSDDGSGEGPREG